MAVISVAAVVVAVILVVVAGVIDGGAGAGGRSSHCSSSRGMRTGAARKAAVSVAPLTCWEMLEPASRPTIVPEAWCAALH